jgi:LPS-assembly protein
LNPVLSLPNNKPWGYVTPAVQMVENHYVLTGSVPDATQTFNRTIPRYSVDSGLTFERTAHVLQSTFTETLEPRLYYLQVPYQNQSIFPAFDSGFMIFTTDQLFRPNRYSGFDRIGDANQLAYALTSRLITDETGQEKASLMVGQIRYFADRRVQLCYAKNGVCTDNPSALGYLSPTAPASPIASHAMYALLPGWIASGDYVWDVNTRAINNGDLNVHYQPEPNHMIRVGYSYLVNGNITQMPNVVLQKKALHQTTVSYAWPLTEQWSTLGVYSYNISERYGMMTFLGMQYDTCCWAVRLFGGQQFQSLSPDALRPQYNKSVYFQLLLKGLGSVSSSDPGSMIQTYLPGYVNVFQPGKSS